MRRVEVLLVLAVAVAVAAGIRWWTHDDPKSRHTVVLVVLDTVRADRTSLCGHDRPTTPVLEQLVRDGASHTCRAYAPSSWTLPSHASFFTGLDLASHGTGATLGEIKMPWKGGARAQPLKAELPTLAERFVERGFQTALVSANPVVGEWTGLSRGFQHVSVARRWPDFRDAGLPRAVEQTLAETDPERPLFLMVNILDAHNDWPAIPPGVDWVPARDSLPLHPTKRRIEALPPGDPGRAELYEALRDLYDHALHVADGNLGRVLGMLAPRLERPHRLIVTSDHGEYLGEHGRVAHGGTELFEPVMRVPLVVQDSERTIPLSGVTSGLAVHDLALDGVFTMQPDEAYAGKLSNAEPDADLARPCVTTGAAIWRGTEKLRCRKGEVVRFDLAADPEESRPQGADDHPMLEDLLRFGLRLEATNAGRGAGDIDIEEALEELGYIE